MRHGLLGVGSANSATVPWSSTSDARKINVTLPTVPRRYVILKWDNVGIQNASGICYYNVDDSVNYGMGAMASGYTSYSIFSASGNVYTLEANRTFGTGYSGTMYALYQ